MLLPENRVECLHEIRPGKLCGAHRSAMDPLCRVCGEFSKTRPVRSPRRVALVLALALRVDPPVRRRSTIH